VARHAAGDEQDGSGHFGFGFQLLGRAVGDDLAAVNNNGPGAGGFDLFQDMSGKNDGLALAHAADQAAHLVFLVGVQPVGRLIHHQDGGVMDDGLGEAGAVTVAFGEGVHTLVADGFEEAHFHDVVDGLGSGVAPEAAQFGAEIEEAFDRHVGVSGGIFREVADEAFGGEGILGDVKPADGDLAGGGGDEAGNHPHGGGFAGAVGAEESEHFAPLHGEGNIVDGQFGAERLAQIFNFNHSKFSKVGRVGPASIRLISGGGVQKQGLTGQRKLDKMAGKCSIIFLILGKKQAGELFRKGSR